MASINNPIRTRRAHGICLATFVALMVLTTVARADDPIPLTVEPIKPIEIGSLSPGEERFINHDDPAAAQFAIRGKENKKVVIAVSIEDLHAQATGDSDHQSNSLTLVATGYSCAYSLDNGETWIPFQTEELVDCVKMPKAPTSDKIGTILLRVGGSVTAGGDQQRGLYLGSVIVNAEYNNGTGPSTGNGSILIPLDLDEDSGSSTGSLIEH